MNHYHRGNFGISGWMTPASRFLLVSTGLVFVAQLIFDLMFSGGFTRVFALSWTGLRHLALWQPVTYMFLHGGILHLLFNMIGLFFFGPETERALGSSRFVRLYLGCGVCGGLGWLALSGAQGSCIGASGAVLGLLAAFATLFPERPITLLVFFVIPVTMRARTMALALGAFTVLMMLSQPGNIAHTAHLVGGLVGWLYIFLVFNRRGVANKGLRAWWNDLRWHWARRNFKVISNPDTMMDDSPPAPPAPEDVDRILEKISRFGLNSLTDAEREILQRASRRRRF